MMPLAACSEAPPQREQIGRPDIILISIDSLRQDHVGCYGYARDTTPTIDRLAREGACFVNAVSTTSWTLPAHAALFTGLYDSSHGVVNIDSQLADEHVTLAEVLRAAGYQTCGFFGGPFLHPTFGLDRGFASYLNCMTTVSDDSPDDVFRSYPAHAASHSDITGPRTLERFGAWLDAADERPMFVFLHLWDVHYDYIPPQHYVDMFDPDYRGSINAEHFNHNDSIRPDMEKRDLQHVIALYDGEIRFTDDMVRQFLARLRDAGRLDQALIVVLSDHGEEFFEHGGKGHQRTLFDEVVRVPLIFWWPARIDTSRLVTDQVSLIDVMPTLLSLAGIPLPVEVQGRDLSPLMDGSSLPGEPALLELLVFGQQARALRTNSYKLLVDDLRKQTGFFDLQLDPNETMNRGQDPRLQVAMADLRSITRQSLDLRRATRSAELSEALMDQLRSLGYTDDAKDSGSERNEGRKD